MKLSCSQNSLSSLSPFSTQEYQKLKSIEKTFFQGEYMTKFWQFQTRGTKSWFLILPQSMMQRNTNCSNNGKEQDLGYSSTICSHSKIHRKPVQTWEAPCSHRVALPISKLPGSPLPSLYKCQMFSNNLMFKGIGLGCHCQCLYRQRKVTAP